MREDNSEPVQVADWLQAHPSDRYLVMVLDSADGSLMRMEAHEANALPSALNDVLIAANTRRWQAQGANCLQRVGCRLDGVMTIRRVNALRDFLHVRARLHLQLQVLDRQIAAELGHILNQLPP